ncbi:aldehyde dehydrogenase [Bacillus sp. FSL W7-1360]
MNMDMRERQQAYVRSGITKPATFREQQLRKLKEMLERYESTLLTAVQRDLNKQSSEAYMTEFGFVYQEITHALESLTAWMKPVKIKTPPSHVGSRSWVQPEPYGSVLVIAPWNYPIQLTLTPLVGALAAGNSVVLKPSELTPHTSRALAEAITATFSPEVVSVVEGDAKVASALLDQPFDYIFFTGSVAVGKIVMEKAARHLTPHTLELGGKSPAIVDKTAKLTMAAKRIAWGKFSNAGQTCIAPDYVLVHQHVYEPFLEQLKKQTLKLFSERTADGTYTQIVNERHFKRLCAYFDDGTIALGGQHDMSTRMIAPTILTDVSWESAVMQEEIFGPILPVIPYDNEDHVLARLHALPNPLALYVFAEDVAIQELFTAQVSFGGGCINDTLMHVANVHLPFGGKGPSGIGAYHGDESFRTFSHQKSLLKQSTTVDIPFRYQTGKLGEKVIRRLMK